MARPAKPRKKRPAPPPFVLDRFSPLLDPDPAAPAHGTYAIKAKVWRYKGKGGWYFANLPKNASAEIRSRFGVSQRGWGSIRVRIRIGGTEWDTSLFPERKTRTYLFAIKASVRQAEGLSDGTPITAQVTVR